MNYKTALFVVLFSSIGCFLIVQKTHAMSFDQPFRTSEHSYEYISGGPIEINTLNFEPPAEHATVTNITLNGRIQIPDNGTCQLHTLWLWIHDGGTTLYSHESQWPKENSNIFVDFPNVNLDFSTLASTTVFSLNFGSSYSKSGWGSTACTWAFYLEDQADVTNSVISNYQTIYTSYTPFLLFNATVDNGHIAGLTADLRPPQAPPQCGPTGFAIPSWNPFGIGAFPAIDFGQGLCNVARFLLVPAPESLNQFTNSKGLLSTTPPFSYLYTLTSAISSASGTAASITPMSLEIGATGTPIHFSQDMFSQNTINKYTSSGTRSTLRTLMQWALYLSFMAMVIVEVRHLFKPHGGAK